MMDVGTIIVFAAFIVLVVAAMVLSHMYGPQRAKELLDTVKEATKELNETMRESIKTIKELKEEKKREEG